MNEKEIQNPKIQFNMKKVKTEAPKEPRNNWFLVRGANLLNIVLGRLNPTL
jgi:hypothetical protein